MRFCPQDSGRLAVALRRLPGRRRRSLQRRTGRTGTASGETARTKGEETTMNTLWLSGVNAVAAAWAQNISRSCWQGGLFILGVWIVCRLLPRLSARLRCDLWWLACLKLLVGSIWMTPLTL